MAKSGEEEGKKWTIERNRKERNNQEKTGKLLTESEENRKKNIEAQKRDKERDREGCR